MGAGKYFTILIVLFISLVGDIVLLFRLKNGFLSESILTALFFIAAIMILAGMLKRRAWTYRFAAIFFILFLVNSFYMYANVSRGVIVFSGMAVLSAIGFMISMIGIKTRHAKRVVKRSGKHAKEEEEKEVPVILPYGFEKNIKKEFKPGKYIGSKKGTTYHIARCDWANNIKGNNRIWFNSKEDAEKKGYKAHSCVK